MSTAGRVLAGAAAVLGAAFVLGLMALAVHHGWAVPGDSKSLDWARSIQWKPFTALAGFFGVIGIFLIVLAASIGAAIFLIARRRPAQAAALVFSVVVSDRLAALMKGEFGRARPSDPVVDVSGFSFPSSHSTIAVFYMAAAVVLAGTLTTPNRRRQLIALGAFTTICIGLSTVYLRGHFLSDVFAGWALGLIVFVPVVGIGAAIDASLARRRP